MCIAAAEASFADRFQLFSKSALPCLRQFDEITCKASEETHKGFLGGVNMMPPFTSDEELSGDHVEVLACLDLKLGIIPPGYSVTFLADEGVFKGVPPRVRLTEVGRGESDDTVERESPRRTRRRDVALPSSASGSSVRLRASSISLSQSAADGILVRLSFFSSYACARRKVKRLCTASSGQATSISRLSWAMVLRLARCFRFQRWT
jgi:hypothetical protein